MKKLLPLLLTLILAFSIISCGESKDKNAEDKPTSVPEKIKIEEPVMEDKPIDPNATEEEIKALEKAKDYVLNYCSSRENIELRLGNAGYADSEIKYAIDNCGANWKKQAARSAQSYINTDPKMTRDELYNQLIFERFTPEEAEYGISSVSF